MLKNKDDSGSTYACVKIINITQKNGLSLDRLLDLQKFCK